MTTSALDQTELLVIAGATLALLAVTAVTLVLLARARGARGKMKPHARPRALPPPPYPRPAYPETAFTAPGRLQRPKIDYSPPPATSIPVEGRPAA